MTTRRNAIKSISLAALALPSLSAPTNDGTPALPSINDPQYWTKIRSQFMLSKDNVFFNPGTVGVMPRVVVDKMTEHVRYLASHVADWAYKDDNKEEFISGYNNLLGIRTKVGKLINANTGEIAMIDNVTNGISYLANGITLQPGDEVVTTNQEHSGGRGGWLVKEKRYGIKFNEVVIGKPIRNSNEVYQDIVNAFTPKTKVLMISHMISGSGAILPVKEICAEASNRGIFTILDGAQTIGHINVDVRDIGCDAYVGCFHKWAGAPAGTGFMYVKQERMKEIWTTVASGRWDNHDDEGFRFTQRGTGNFSVLKGLDAALDFIFEIGPDRVYARIKFLGDRLRAGLRQNPNVKIYSPEEEAMCAGITVYKVNGMTGAQLQEAFWDRGNMRPRSSGEQFGVRHCTHIFNSEEEIDKALTIVRDLSKG
ncbi:MAG: aminotransferase class V-fold PLP-dependent enzyme [Cyclobacteriaceae bacterium]|nr:aminotransferase class V-fold PLP-dependent enzyme [Cyclobacteriaceae bacterium]